MMSGRDGNKKGAGKLSRKERGEREERETKNVGVEGVRE